MELPGATGSPVLPLGQAPRTEGGQCREHAVAAHGVCFPTMES
jgi:hypothetical protein